MARALFAAAIAVTLPGAGGLGAQAAGPLALSGADSALVGRILRAEDRRDPTDAALRDGGRHPHPAIRALAARALDRISDARYAARESLAPLPQAPAWPEPAWRLRFRALGAVRADCAALRAALTDPSWPVRLRAAQFAASPPPPPPPGAPRGEAASPVCAGDATVVATLIRWIDALPDEATERRAGEVSWHAAAHGLAALARLSAPDARTRLPRAAGHAQWQLRQYAARAAALLADTAQLRALAGDRDDNVKEAAIEGLTRLAGHAADDLYLAALDADGAQAVRAAAVALKGSPHPAAARAASHAFSRFVARANASEWDTRHALLAAAGRDVREDRPPPRPAALPADAVPLALGADVRLRVTMAATSGGGGTFVVRLRGDAAPVMAARLLALARAGYYDGLTWHRVEHDFVIQGGSPGASEYVGHREALRDELGTVSHRRGTVGMSTRGHDTGDAQWFVNLRDNARLDRDYTVWGEVVEGMDVVDGVLEGDVIASVRPVGGT
jgi:cyclophilin family peptidyl-prolyl cis-trans isomerase